MIPSFDAKGRLPAGIHFATWEQVVSRFGFTTWRRTLLSGMKEGLLLLKRAGCRLAYIDGSFVTRKLEPDDFDVCWQTTGTKIKQLDPVFLDFTNRREKQKRRFGGEFFPAEMPVGTSGKRYLDFFQSDRDTTEVKGIVALDLRRLRS